VGEFVRLEVDEASRVGTIRLDRQPVNAQLAQSAEGVKRRRPAAGGDFPFLSVAPISSREAQRPGVPPHG
jgi:hypothetical protein